MIDKYAVEATRRHMERNLLELSDAGTLRVARFAHDMVSWHFGIEEVIVAALDMANKGRAACEEKKVIPPPGMAQSLEYYLGTNLYDPTIDIESVECSCVPSVVERLKSCANTQTVGNERRRWKTEDATANLRVPAILCLGGCCSAFASGKNPKKDSREIDRFLEAFETAARQYGQSPDKEPRDIGKEDPRDLTLGDQDIDDTMGPVRRNSRLTNLKPYKTSIEYSVENALIVVSRVAITYGNAIGYGPRKPAVANLWLGNGFGRTLAIFEGETPNGPLKYGTVEYGGKRQPAEVMRATIFSLLGCSNFVVGFNLGWTLTALNLVLPGHRVMDLGTEPAFQHWCRRLTVRRSGWRDAFIENMVNSYDRRIPAMFYDIDLCSTPGEVDPIRELYYTAAIWNIIQKQTKAIRELPEVHKIKMLVPVGSGDAVQPEDDIMFKNQILLTLVEGRPPATELKATASEVLALLHEAPLDGIGWHGDQAEFLKKCMEMVVEWANLSLQCDSYISEYGKYQERCQFAVNLALPSRRVEGDAGLMTRMINHHSGATLQDMRGINLNEPEIRTYAGPRLFTCWLDFGLRREMIKTAQPPPPPAQDFIKLPDYVLASTLAPPAATRSTSVMPTQPGTSTHRKCSGS